ncbi:transglycosylase SLT domain-containing protein [Cetobacterium sp. SF1]|uniref:transglycosylase SLT domain-containing protein n=1 Tax=Cetobacterium sp. SF1 TaxID=3417654 RepID=UPI003CEBD9C4
MKKKVLIFLSIISSLSFSNDYSSEYEKYKENRLEMYSSYKKEIERRFNNYKNNISEQWKEIEVPDNYKWVEYNNNYKEKTVVDYKDENIRIEVIVPKKSSQKENEKKILKNMEKIMEQHVKNASKKNPYLKENEVINSSELIVGDIYKIQNSDKVNNEKIKNILKDANLKKKSAKNSGEEVIEVTIPFPKDGILVKAKKYKEDVNKRAVEYKVDKSLIYAIIHSESGYNPMARSAVPAYGLMQIVPTSAGKAITERLYGKARILSPEYLYNGSKNIEAGTNYINFLYYYYFDKVKDPVSRKYCTIAAYNTGAGNVAKAFTGKTKIRPAVEIINKMSSKEVYYKLLKSLPYDETKGYLKKVSTRDRYYKTKSGEI